MPREKKILDIRYYSDRKLNSKGKYVSIFTIKKESLFQGARIARKLRELGFITGDFHHVYINFTDKLSHSEITISKKPCEKWFKYFDVGIDTKITNQFSSIDRQNFIEEKTFQVLSLINNNQQILIDQVKKELSLKGSEIEILHKYKETKSYKLKLTYQIHPKNSDNSIAKVYYHNKKTNNTFTSQIVLKFYEDIFFLASSISVNKGIIKLKPRSSFKAKIFNAKYNVPITIQIA